MRDVLTITLLSVVPMILYRIAWHFLWFGGLGRRRDQRGPNTALIGLAAFIFYFITNLLVLYASRIREYFADRGSVSLGNEPSWLASGLYKLAYGSARADRDSLKQVEGLTCISHHIPTATASLVTSTALRSLRVLSVLQRVRLRALQSQALYLQQVTLFRYEIW